MSLRRFAIYLVAFGVAVTALVVVARRDDLPYEAIAKCTQPTVAEPPPVVEDQQIGVVAVEVADIGQGTALIPWHDGERLLLATRLGEVWLVDPTGASAPQRLLDLSDGLVLNNEGGLIGMALAPAGDYVYLHLTDADGTSEIVEMAVTGDAAIDTSSRRVVLRQPHPGLVHNGGALVFGPDGYLYLGFGDGGGRPTDAERVRSLEHWDGKILRIDPRGIADGDYVVPEDNPFVDEDRARPEIWSLGLRNPYQFTIDARSNSLWIADVGELCFEEINRVGIGEGGIDFGFPAFEAFHEFLGGPTGQAAFPRFSYEHGENCAVIGGPVLRDPSQASMAGGFLFSDLCGGQLRVLEDGGDEVRLTDLGLRLEGVQAFGTGPDLAAYVLTTQAVFRLEWPGG